MKEQQISTDVLLEKYAKNGETTKEEIFRRVAYALASVESCHNTTVEESFFDAMMSGFIPAGRIMSAAGTGIDATLINCFVQPVGDATVGVDEAGRPGIYAALADAAETMRRGGGVGYNFSHIRPRGAAVKGTASHASGPVSYMRVFDRSCETVESAGARRGAQMGILNIDHPDIMEFIHAKDGGDLTNFNLSVGVTDEFMLALNDGKNWIMESHGIRREINSRDLWNDIMRSTYDHAEPGVVFVDTWNDTNQLKHIEKIECCNPCAEQPLPDYGCCCLGSIDLTRFVFGPFTDCAAFNYDGFKSVVEVAVRMLDNVLDCTYWPLPKQKAEAMAKRRIGLGFTGLGDALIMLNVRYDTDEARDIARFITRTMFETAQKASAELAYKGIPTACIQAGLNRRNSHLVSIAPTGTISLAFADNCSNGIEPPFSWTYDRKKRLAGGGHAVYKVEDHAYRLYKDMFGKEPPLGEGPWITALEISATDHMQMLEAVQSYIDSSISKTVNVPADYHYDGFKDLYVDAWKAGLKGLATYRPNAVLGSVLSVESPKQELDHKQASVESPKLDAVKTENVTAPAVTSSNRRRPRDPSGHPAWVYYVDHPVGNFAVFITENPETKLPFEVWVNGYASNSALGALAKSLSKDMRLGSLDWVMEKINLLRDIPEPNGAFWAHVPGSDKKRLFPSVVALMAELVWYRYQQLGFLTATGVEDTQQKSDDAQAIPRYGKKCPECGMNTLRKRDGCEKCDNCGYQGGCG